MFGTLISFSKSDIDHLEIYENRVLRDHEIDYLKYKIQTAKSQRMLNAFFVLLMTSMVISQGYDALTAWDQAHKVLSVIQFLLLGIATYVGVMHFVLASSNTKVIKKANQIIDNNINPEEI